MSAPRDSGCGAPEDTTHILPGLRTGAEMTETVEYLIALSNDAREADSFFESLRYLRMAYELCPAEAFGQWLSA